MLKEKGRYFELPIEGAKIHTIVYNGRLRLVFDDTDESHLELDGEFNVEKYNQTVMLHPKSKDALVLFYDMFNAGTRIREAKADKFGQLFLTFDNGFELIVEDGPYENWHFTKIDKQKHTTCLHVHGGVGRTIF